MRNRGLNREPGNRRLRHKKGEHAGKDQESAHSPLNQAGRLLCQSVAPSPRATRRFSLLNLGTGQRRRQGPDNDPYEILMPGEGMRSYRRNEDRKLKIIRATHTATMPSIRAIPPAMAVSGIPSAMITARFLVWLLVTLGSPRMRAS